MTIRNFSRKYGFLSNFSTSPIVWENREWKTVEHLFQARKTNSSTEQEKIRKAITPGRAKRMGRKVPLREDWEQVKYEVMLECIGLKFADKNMAKKLMGTYPHYLIEGNHWHDNEWGDCTCAKCVNVVGKNMLGVILMKVRATLTDLYDNNDLEDHSWHEAYDRLA